MAAGARAAPLRRSAPRPHVKLLPWKPSTIMQARVRQTGWSSAPSPIPDPGDLLARLPGQAALAWVRHGEGLAGWGESARITIPAGEDRFTAGEKWLRELFDGAAVTDELAVPGSGPVAFGSFTFDPASDGSVLVVPRTVVGRRGGLAWLTTITDGPGPAGAAGIPGAGTGRRPLARRQPERPAVAARGGGRGGQDPGRRPGQGGAGQGPVRGGRRMTSTCACCWPGSPRATRTAIRSPARDWPARLRSC